MSEIQVGTLNMEYGTKGGLQLPKYSLSATGAPALPSTGVATGDICFEIDEKIVMIYVTNQWVEISDIL